eukprot:scaffold5662_cov149-Isochrysis_galbana.AAC.3
MGCHPDTGLGCRRVLLCCSIAAVDGSRSRIVAGSSRTNRLAAMPPFLALCGGVVGVGWLRTGCAPVCWLPAAAACLSPDISTHISISAAHSVSSHTDRASRHTRQGQGRPLLGKLPVSPSCDHALQGQGATIYSICIYLLPPVSMPNIEPSHAPAPMQGRKEAVVAY